MFNHTRHMHAATQSHTDFPVLKPVFILGLPSPQLITPCCLSVLTCLQICKRSGKQLQKILSCVESAFAFKRKAFLWRARVPAHLHRSRTRNWWQKWKNGSDNDNGYGFYLFWVVDLTRLILREVVSQPSCLWEVLLDTSSQISHMFWACWVFDTNRSGTM